MIGIENSVKLITIRKPIQFQHSISFLFPSFKGRNLIFNLYLLNNSFRSTWEIGLDNNFIDFPQKRKKKEKRAERANFYSLFTEINPSFFHTIHTIDPSRRGNDITEQKRFDYARILRLMNFVGCAEYPAFLPCARNTTHTLDLRRWHSEGARDRWRDQDGFQTPVRPPFLLLSSLSFPPGRRETAMDTSLPDATRHDTTAEALKPANLFLLSFHATRPPHSRTPLHSARSAPLDNVADKVARNVVAGIFFLLFLGARIKRYELLHG